MGGGGTISESISGGHKKLFLTILYNFKNIWGGGGRLSHSNAMLLRCCRGHLHDSKYVVTD